MALTKKTIKWLSKHSINRLNGKTVLVTGANSGVGYKTVEICLYLGANVIMACRNMDRATSAKERLLLDYPNAVIDIMEFDLANLSSIHRFVKRIIDEKIDIDMFVNNAGAFKQPNKRTFDGFDFVIGTNYIGVFYLTEKILPYLETLNHKVYYVNTISIIYKSAKKIDYNDFYCQNRYRALSVYARSKIALTKYTYYKAKEREGNNVVILMNHPGIAITPLGLNAVRPFLVKLSKYVKWMFNSPEKSALSVPFIFSHNLNGGMIIGPSRCFGGWGYPRVNKTLRKVKVGGQELIDFTNKEINNVSND